LSFVLDGRIIWSQTISGILLVLFLRTPCLDSQIIPESLHNMPDLPPIYNSRILKICIEYLHANYPDVDVEPILRYANVTRYEVDDPGHWFNQQHIDRFYAKVVEATGNDFIARDAGRFSVSADASGAVKQRVLGLLQVSSIYLLIAKLYPMISLGADVSSRKISANCVEITVIPNQQVQENPHQCKHRIGIFEALATVSTHKFAQVEHTECVHQGDSCCRYRVKWEDPLHRRWNRYLTVAIFLMIACAPPAYHFLEITQWLVLLLSGVVGLLLVCLSANHYRTKDLMQKIISQGNVAEDHVKEIDYRYRGALLIQKIGQATSMTLDTNQLVRIVTETIKHYLDFDRGIIMLADKARKRLIYEAGYGFDEQMTDLLTKTHFRLDNPDAEGIFIQTFHRQRAILVDDLDMLRESFSVRSQKFASQIGSRSLICIPIVYERTSIGILVVDNIITKRPLTKSDLNLLMGVTSQIAVSLSSAEAVRELRRSEERFRSLYENAPTAYVSIRASDAAIVNCNAAAVELLGYDRNQLIGSSLMDHVAPKEAGAMGSPMLLELLQNGQSVRNESMRLVHRDGRFLWGNVSLDPFKDSQGRVIEGRCIIIDTTEQTQLEEQLRNAQRMETIGMLAGGVAHDLSNILSAIVSYPDLILMDIKPDSSLYEPLSKIKSAGGRAAAMVHDLLTLARRGVPVKNVVMVNELVKEYLASPEFESLLARNPNITVEDQLDAALLAIKGSEMHLTKALMNIMINAAEAIPDGGFIRISTHKETVRPDDPRSPVRGGEHVVLSVKDDGHGIAPEDLKHVFEPFFSTKRMGRSGTGLGMAIVWAAVHDLDGFIDIDSRLNIGTTVRLYFPATSDKTFSHSNPPILIEDYKGRGEVVLLVEDDTEHREIAGRMLSRLGYRVIAVNCGEAALAELEKDRPDLVVLDMILGPGLDGLATYQRILNMNPRQRAIIASGFAETSRVRKALELGAGAYIKKPYSLKEIGVAVRYELDREAS
jgi:PAS domain S-box-containing protein